MAKPLENQGQAFAQDEPSGVVSGAYIHSASWTCRLFFHSSEAGGGLPLTYLYVGATLPVALLLLRQALDFSYKEELVINTLADYVEQMRTWAEEIPAGKKTDPVLQEEVIDRITSSIKQTAASGSHFSKMLTPEEEKIMREIIREFMA